MTQNRWKSKVTWAGIAATLLILFGQVGLYEAVGITQEWAQTVADLVLSLLVAFGVLNNPTNPKEF